MTPGPSVASLQADAALEGGPIDLGNAPTQLDYGSVGQPPPTVQPLMAPGALTAPAEANNLPDFAPLRNAWPDSPLSGKREADSPVPHPTSPGQGRKRTRFLDWVGLSRAVIRLKHRLGCRRASNSSHPGVLRNLTQESLLSGNRAARTRLSRGLASLGMTVGWRAILKKAAWSNWRRFFPSTESSRDSLASAAAASPRLPAGVNVVQMDNGVALFHAFDLGTSPNEHHGQAGPVAQEDERD